MYLERKIDIMLSSLIRLGVAMAAGYLGGVVGGAYERGKQDGLKEAEEKVPTEQHPPYSNSSYYHPNTVSYSSPSYQNECKSFGSMFSSPFQPKSKPEPKPISKEELKKEILEELLAELKKNKAEPCTCATPPHPNVANPPQSIPIVFPDRKIDNSYSSLEIGKNDK